MNLKKLSEYLGLSPTTVSRALNGFPEVSEKTRFRVQEAAQKLGYVPSRSARSLATGRAYAIGHVLLQSDEDAMNPVFGDFISAAGAVYASKGYRLVMSVIPKEAENAEYHDLVRQHAVDGIVVHSPNIDEPRLELLKSLGLPFLIHGRAGGMEYDYSFIDVNNRRAFRRACHYLIELGHRRIALLNGPEEKNFAYRRRLGYEDALGAAEIEVDTSIIRSARMTMDFGYRASMELLSLPNPPSAVLCSSSLIAHGVQYTAMHRGMVLGRDLSLITHDDEIKFLIDGHDDEYNFTCMRSSVRAAGHRAAELLIDLIENPDGRHRQELWEAELIVGATTGSPYP